MQIYLRCGYDPSSSPAKLFPQNKISKPSTKNKKNLFPFALLLRIVLKNHYMKYFEVIQPCGTQSLL